MAAEALDAGIANATGTVEMMGVVYGYESAKVTTITVNVKLDVGTGGIDLVEVARNCEDNVRTEKTARPNNKKGTYRRFQHSITLMFDKIAMKVFKNGSLHLTGCPSVAKAHECVAKFMLMMRWDMLCAEEEALVPGMAEATEAMEAMEVTEAAVEVPGVPIIMPDTPMFAELVAETKILTFNTVIKMQPGRNISLARVHELLNKNGNNSASEYNPDVWPNVKARVMMPPTDPLADPVQSVRKVSVIVYHTGNMMISAKTPEEAIRAFSVVANELAKSEAEA